MAQTLEELKDELYAAFNRSIKGSKMSPEANYNNEQAARLQASAACTQAAAQTAEAIAKVERELTVRDMIKELRKQGADIEVDIEKGIVRSISPMSKIRLKGPEASGA